MELSSRFVGLALKDHFTEVGWRDTMNYAAAIDDCNPVYLDDEREGGVIAPPMFSVALTWPIVENLWDYLEADDFPMEIIATQVHYTEHLEFHRPVRPGDALTVKGRIAAILPHRAGSHVVIRFDALDGKAAPVFTEHIGALMRGVSCVDGASGAETLPIVPESVGEGRIRWETVIPIDPLRSYVYDGCSRIFFPIHTSRGFARRVGLPGIILQGTATLAFAARDLVDREAVGDPTRLESLYCRFTGVVKPGTDIRVQLLGATPREGVTDLFFIVLNHEGRKAVSNGRASIRV